MKTESQAAGHAPQAGGGVTRAGALTPGGVWEQTFDALADPVSIVDASFHVLAANAAYKRTFGLEGGIPAGHPCFTSGGGLQPCDGCPLVTTIQTGVPHMVRQERMAPAGDMSDGGAPRWERRVYERWTYPLVDEEGIVSRAVEVIRDVTERERLAEMSIKAEAYHLADQLKTELLGAISHELRSPLTAIRGYADTLTRYEARLSPQERREFLTAISEASERLSAEIERLLLYSRLESGDVKLDTAPVDMARLASEAATAAQARAGQRAHISLMVSDDVSLVARGDSRRLREALDALLDNAITYAADPGEISITVDASTLPDDAGELPAVRVVVRDDGRGIPHESLPFIFDAFHRVETGLTRAVEGIGLGLALCKRIVTLSGGHLLVTSAPTMGSAFTILLPAAQAGDGHGIAAQASRARTRP